MLTKYSGRHAVKVRPLNIIIAFYLLQCPELMCMWPTLVLKLTKFHHGKTKTFSLVSFLAKLNKDVLSILGKPWKRKDVAFSLGHESGC